MNSQQPVIVTRNFRNDTRELTRQLAPLLSRQMKLLLLLLMIRSEVEMY